MPAPQPDSQTPDYENITPTAQSTGVEIAIKMILQHAIASSSLESPFCEMLNRLSISGIHFAICKRDFRFRVSILQFAKATFHFRNLFCKMHIQPAISGVRFAFCKHDYLNQEPVLQFAMVYIDNGCSFCKM